MKKLTITLVTCCLLVFCFSCEKDEVFEPVKYECDFTFPDSSELHPNASVYQTILDNNIKQGLVGATLLVKDSHGLWMGASGKSDIASSIEVQPCNRFLIASISKVFTASAIFRYIDEGLISLEDPVNQWLDEDVVAKVANTDKATIGQLLNHTSGIPDYYTLQYLLDILNKKHNKWLHEDILEYAYGLDANNAPGEAYYYSNSNYLLLGMILENVSGLPLDRVYEEEIFIPLILTSAYFDMEDPIPADVVKGYADLYGNGQLVESEFLFKDELGTGDGGIVMNNYDLAMFFEGLMKGDLVSFESLGQMTDWFDLPEGWGYDALSFTQNGSGLQHYTTPYGNAVGHTGSIYGFYSIAQYFPEQDATFILLTNTATYENEQKTNIYHQCMEVMFE